MSRKSKKRKRLGWVLALIIFVIALRQWPQNLAPHDTSPSSQSQSTPPAEAIRTPDSPTPSREESSPGHEPMRTEEAFHDFDGAKQHLKKLFGRGREFYCACSYDFARKPSVDPGSCGLVSKSARAKRIEWEHVVPASFYGRQFKAWRQGDDACTGKKRKGRECARKISAEFRQMEGDMYNLVPAVGELNQVRSDTAYGIVPGEPREFGACDFESFVRLTEPRPQIRGDIARIYFYMDARYPRFKIVNVTNQDLFVEWAAQDPLDEGEKSRLQKIEAIQGNSFFIGRLARSEPSISPNRKTQ